MIDETTTPEAPVSVEVTPPTEQPTDAAQAKAAQKEYNYRVLRERAEAAEAKMADMERERGHKRQDQVQQYNDESSDDDFGLDPDSYVEAKHIKKIISRLKAENRETKKQLEEVASKAIVSATESRLKANYNDFDHIVSNENLKNLAAIHPEDYASMMSNPDLYAKSKTAYNMIKNYGIANERIREADEKLAANKLRPQSSSAVSPHVPESVLGRVGDYDRRVLSEAQKEQVRKRLQEAKRF